VVGGLTINHTHSRAPARVASAVEFSQESQIATSEPHERAHLFDQRIDNRMRIFRLSTGGRWTYSPCELIASPEAIVPRYTIDRFEGGNWAVLEEESARAFTVPRGWLPSGARERDVVTTLETTHDPSTTTVRFELDPEARDEQLAKARARREALPRGPKGDISL
jgi:hypothetical protein